MTDSSRARPRLRALDVVDVFVYTVVLALFVQFFPEVVTESCAGTKLTAQLHKGGLEHGGGVQNAQLRGIREGSPWRRVLSGAALLLVLPGSKILVLEATALVFRGDVHLGNFLQVTLLVIVLMLARAGVRKIVAPEPERDDPS